MHITRLRIFAHLLTTFVAIIFIVISFYFSGLSVLILSLEVILLPSIYIISNLYIEDLIKTRYDAKLNSIHSLVRELDRKVIEKDKEIENLKYKLSLENYDEKE